MDQQKDDLESYVRSNDRKLFGFIRNRVKTNEDAEDILQEVWYQFSRIASFDDIESISGWLYRVARNKIVDLYRKPKEDSYGDTLFDGDYGGELKEILFGEAESVEQTLFKEAFWQRLMNALDELPEAQKTAFVDSELEGKKLKDIAEESGQNIKTIISRKQYAVKHIRKRLQDLYDEL